MQYDLTQVRNDMLAYRRRFNDRFREVYGVPFSNYVHGTKLYIGRMLMEPYGRTKAEEAAREYENRIKYIKSLIE